MSVKVELTRTEFDALIEWHDEEDVLADYSGRGMYQSTCLGYVGGMVHVFLHDLADLLVRRNNDDPDCDDIRSELAMIGLGRTDGMGHSTVYYWPSITVEEEEEDYED